MKLKPPLFILILLLSMSACAYEKPVKEADAMEVSSKQNEKIIPAPEITIDDVMGKFSPPEHKDFIAIDTQYASREGMYLHKETYAAFEKMHAAAKVDNINLTIRSATRNFYDQKRIWENKWNGITLVESGQNLAETVTDPEERALVILRYSSMPGSSRHHWGTDIDINNFENSYFETGQGLKEYEWLIANAPLFGFCQPYTVKDDKRPNGYFEEKWHWSFLPIAQPLSAFLEKNLTNKMIQGFEGAETAIPINIKENYMLGINKACLH